MIITYIGERNTFGYRGVRFDKGVPTYCKSGMVRQLRYVADFELYDESKKYNECRILIKLDSDLELFCASIPVVEYIKSIFPTAKIYIKSGIDLLNIFPNYCQKSEKRPKDTEYYRVFNISRSNKSINNLWNPLNIYTQSIESLILQGLQIVERPTALKNNLKQYRSKTSSELIFVFRNNLFPTNIEKAIELLEPEYKIVYINRYDQSNIQLYFEYLCNVKYAIFTEYSNLSSMALYLNTPTFMFMHRDKNPVDAIYNRFENIKLSYKDSWQNIEPEKIATKIKELINEQ